MDKISQGVFTMLYMLILLLFISFFIVFKKATKYKYDQKKDYIYDLKKHFIKEIDLDTTNLDLQTDDNYDTLFLEIKITTNLLSYFVKPYMQIGNTKHSFEYGARGLRYINISHIKSNDQIKTNIKLASKTSKLYGFKNKIDLESDTILILAPHADDAEIAAFGLYKTAKNVTIVTTTMGEKGVCNYCDFYAGNKTEAAQKKAHLRLLDALHIPSFGEVAVENSIALGYFGGSLEFMYNNTEQNAVSSIKDFGSMQKYRKVNHAKIQLPQKVDPNFQAFYNDIKEIVTQLQPKIIITPHPQIDSHPDHKYTTLSLLKALDNLKLDTQILLYTNHLKQSEIYPIGEMFGSVDLPVNFSKFKYDSIYSFILNDELQKEKYFALEAIHDLRDSFLPISLKRAYKNCTRLLKKELLTKDKSYFRRAVRKHELFFVLQHKNYKKFFQEK